MTQNYTLDDLVRLIYREASTTERLSMEIDLDRDYELREELKDLQFAIHAGKRDDRVAMVHIQVANEPSLRSFCCHCNQAQPPQPLLVYLEE